MHEPFHRSVKELDQHLVMEEVGIVSDHNMEHEIPSKDGHCREETQTRVGEKVVFELKFYKKF